MLLASSALTGESIEESSSFIVDHSTVGWQGTVTSCERGLVVVPTYYSTISQPKAHGFIAIFIFHRKSCGIWVLPGGGGGGGGGGVVGAFDSMASHDTNNI